MVASTSDMTRSRRTLPRPWLEVTVTAALALVIIIIPLLTLRPEPDEPSPSIRTSAETIITVPAVSKQQRQKTRRELTRFVDALYTRAFLPEQAAKEERLDAIPTAEGRIASMFGRRARKTLSKSPEVFELGSLRVQRGHAALRGVATVEGKRATTALLRVKFVGVAEARKSDPLVDVRQVGTLLLKHGAHGWKVGGFELRLKTKPIPPITPAPSAGRER